MKGDIIFAIIAITFSLVTIYFGLAKEEKRIEINQARIATQYMGVGK